VGSDVRVDRDQVVAFRWRAHQLGRAAGSGTLADTVLLDLGVQDTGPRGARWALANRGVEGYDDADTLLAWTLRVSPHLYRRSDQVAVMVATTPLSEADATKRVYDASKPLREAGIDVLDALAVLAGKQRDIVTDPMDKGTLSTALTGRLDPPYLRRCVPCKTTHAWESPFRMAALQGGLELQPGTSPPVLRRIPRVKPRLFGTLGVRADPRFDVVRGYLRCFGPARPQDAATYLDAPVKDVTAHWPDDAVPVEVRGAPGAWSVLAEDLEALTDKPSAEGTVRLLGAYDAWLQLRDRETLVPERARAKDLWRNLGRPGAVVRDGMVVGTWRPRSAGSRLTVTWEPWTRPTRVLSAAVEEQAERLAEIREQTLAGVET